MSRLSANDDGGSRDRETTVSPWWIVRLEHRDRGARKLAAAILVDVSRGEPQAAVPSFALELVCRLPNDGFTLTDLEVDVWMQIEIRDSSWPIWHGRVTRRRLGARAERLKALASSPWGRGRRRGGTESRDCGAGRRGLASLRGFQSVTAGASASADWRRAAASRGDGMTSTARRAWWIT